MYQSEWYYGKVCNIKSQGFISAEKRVFALHLQSVTLAAILLSEQIASNSLRSSRFLPPFAPPLPLVAHFVDGHIESFIQLKVCKQ